MDTLASIITIVFFVGILILVFFLKYDFINPYKKPHWYEHYVEYKNKDKPKKK